MCITESAQTTATVKKTLQSKVIQWPAMATATATEHTTEHTNRYQQRAVDDDDNRITE